MIKTKASKVLFHLSESEEEEEDAEEMPKVSMSGRLANGGDRFGSTGMRKGLFLGSREDDDYEIVTPIITDYTPQVKQHARINIVAEVEHGEKEINEDAPKLTDSCPIPSLRGNAIQEGEELRLTTPRREVLKLDFQSNSEQGEDSESASQTQSPDENERNLGKEDIQRKDLLTSKLYALKDVTFTLAVKNSDEAIEKRLKQFSTRQLQVGSISHFNIMRDQSGFNTFWPEFKMHFADNATCFLHAKKMKGCTGANYYIASQQGIDNTKSQCFQGKLRGNYAENIYNIFDAGVSPSKVGSQTKVRTIQATIHILPQQEDKGPRIVEMYALKPGCPYFSLTNTSFGEQKNLHQLYEEQLNRPMIRYYKSRRAIYSKFVDGFTLNFSGRVQQPSVKNSILEEVETGRQVVMIGKTRDDIFRLDVSGGLSPMLAFCLAIANFDSKYI